MRVLVGGVGYRFLRDESVGPWAVEQLAPRANGAVEVEDLGYHPVGFVHVPADLVGHGDDGCSQRPGCRLDMPAAVAGSLAIIAACLEDSTLL